MDFIGRIIAPALETIVDSLTRFVRDDVTLRKIQALNAARQSYFDQAVATGATIVFVPQAQQGEQTFSFLLFVTDELSGRGRFMINGTPVSATRGFPIQSAGFQVLISGHENIKAFQAQAEAGQTLNYTWGVFQ